MISRTTHDRADLIAFLSRNEEQSEFAHCPHCRDENGDPLDDFPATASGERDECDCEDGRIRLEKCDGCGHSFAELYAYRDEYLCGDCFDEAREVEAIKPVEVETIDLVAFTRKIVGVE